MINVGTATGIQAFCATPLRHPARALNTAPHALPGAFEMEGHTQASGAAIDWLRSLLGDPTPEELVALAASVPPGADGVVVLPTFNGVSAPIAMPRLAASIHGLRLRHDRSHVARAMLEAICYEAKWILGSLELAVGPTDEIVLVGGFARSRWTAQLMANVLGIRVLRAETEDAALPGAARLALKSLGHDGEGLVRFRDELIPDPAAHAAHVGAFETFVQLVEERQEVDWDA